MSFSCAHIDLETEYCRRLKCTCVPGRRGCVLRGKVTFAIPAEERIAMLEKESGQKPESSGQTARKFERGTEHGK